MTTQPAETTEPVKPTVLKPSNSGAKMSAVSKASERAEKNTMLSDYFSQKKAMKWNEMNKGTTDNWFVCQVNWNWKHL